jgi:two-component sensor histidine kinase
VAILAALASAATLAYVLFARTQQQFSNLERASSALASQNEELEEHVRQRTTEAEEARAHAERERARVETLLQDTNHRIGNSLATVSSLLGLQVTRTRSEEVRMALDAAQARVHAIASAHRRLRLGADLETINAEEFLASVLEDLRTTHAVGRNVTFQGEFEPLLINARDATTIGIVLGELITNALKHAFPGDASGTIWAKLKKTADGIAVLTVEDDGRGIPGDGAKSESGLGAMIIKQLARQFGGEPTYEARPEGGTRVSVSLPDLDRPAPAAT